MRLLVLMGLALLLAYWLRSEVVRVLTHAHTVLATVTH